jgi:hypothetical protein
VDGTHLGNQIAQYVDANFFRPVPEPGAVALAVLGVMGLQSIRRKLKRA